MDGQPASPLIAGLTILSVQGLQAIIDNLTARIVVLEAASPAVETAKAPA